jgi:F-type H+-transporting ATPase subunit epsilon
MASPESRTSNLPAQEAGLRLDVATPEQLLISQQVEMVTAPGSEGEFGVLPGHCPFFTSLRQGTLRYEVGGRTTEISISGGFAHVADNHVIILADSVITS